jgi:hypothetical protein
MMVSRGRVESNQGCLAGVAKVGSEVGDLQGEAMEAMGRGC